MWIIPARAGFTAGLGRREHEDGDHPRSRGVYSTSHSRKEKEEGSSPLARGLRITYAEAACLIRIIPARAGFTRDGPPRIRPGRDHPRSRGVYTAVARGLCMRHGSSPLARGLRQGRRVRVVNGGIIPARAGFTRPTRSPRTRSGDHPRSRGVYVRVSPPVVSPAGSSPLARGLRSRCP